MRKLFAFISALFVLPLAAQDAGAVRQLQKLTQVYRYLDGLYVDEVDMQPLVESAISGMLEELDPHSAYIGADEMKGVQESFEGEFSGIGVEFNILRDTVIVVNTIVGGPAERVGVQPNDRIVPWVSSRRTSPSTCAERPARRSRLTSCARANRNRSTS